MMHHFFSRIQGWSSFLSLYDEAVRDAPKSGAVFVEIGAWRGRSASYMGVEIANSGKQIEFHVVDHFEGSAEHIARQEEVIVEHKLFHVFTENTKPVAKYLTVHRADSLSAAQEFADESVTFLLLDGSHDYDSVLADLRAWYPKVKPGCVMAGDDWTKPGVVQAVTEFFGELGVEVIPCCGKERRKCWRTKKPLR